jgi:hypothetical protein
MCHGCALIVASIQSSRLAQASGRPLGPFVHSHTHVTLSELCRDLELAAQLADVPAGAPAIGSRVKIRVQQALAYGLACDIESAPHLAGLLTEAHAPPTAPATGQALEVIVLDVHPVDAIVDLSANKVC